MYGYTIDKGQIVINPAQATVIQMIFSEYIKGKGCTVVANMLRSRNVPTLNGGQWTPSYVSLILRNEKLTGNAVLQKRYVRDHLKKELIKNKDQLPQYFAEGTHPAIIDPDTFQKVQDLLSQRQEKYAAKNPIGEAMPFS
jgi:site-specific DNA recombinase